MFRFLLAALFLSLSVTAMAATDQTSSKTSSTSVSEDGGKAHTTERRAKHARGERTWDGERSARKGTHPRARGESNNTEGSHKRERGEYRGKRGYHRGHGDAKRTYTEEERAERQAKREEWRKQREAERKTRDGANE